MALRWEIAGLFSSSGVVIKSNVRAWGYGALTDWIWLQLHHYVISPTPMWYCEIYLGICNNSEFEHIQWGGGAVRNVEKEDKKMRGRSNVTMCEWLINSFFSFCDLQPLKTETCWYSKKGSVSLYLRGTTTLLLKLIWKENYDFRHIFLIYLVAINSWRGNFYSQLKLWAAEHSTRLFTQNYYAVTMQEIYTTYVV